MLSFSAQYTQEKKNMLTPNGCETLVFSKKRKNTDAQLLRFKKTLDRFKFSNETKQRENAHPNGCESSEDGCETLRSATQQCSASQLKKRKNTDAQLLRFKKTLDRFQVFQRNETTRKCSPERLRK
jgi:hypothetical protein